MSIVVRCPECGALLKFRGEALGKRAKCTKCNSIVQIVPASESRKGDADEAAVFRDSPPAGSDLPPAEQIATPAPVEAVANRATADEATDGHTLLAARRRLRIIILVLLFLPIALAIHVNLLTRLLSCFFPLLLLGTYRTSRIRGDRFTTRFYLAFVPIVTKRCNLRGVTFLDVKYGHEGSGLWTFVLFGPFQMVFGWLFDFLIPTIGGPFQIDLTTATGRELPAWRGVDQPKFRSTLDLLTSLTGAEIRAR